MARYATIDVGTNSVLLLVAERGPDGRIVPLREEAEITRLGRGVDASGVLSKEGIEATVEVLQRYAKSARALGVEGLAVSATSAARDAKNGQDFLREAKARAGVEVEIIAGEQEARLSFLGVCSGLDPAHFPLVVVDIGGGSTELIFGGEGERATEVRYRHSFDVGAVRLTERFVRSDPLPAAEQEAVLDFLQKTLAPVPAPPRNATVVGVAGTVTTLYALEHAIDPYDAARVEGGRLGLTELTTLREKLCATPLARRRELPGLQPKRADVICAGAMILEAVLERLGASSCVVSDRGLRWGLWRSRFGAVAG